MKAQVVCIRHPKYDGGQSPVLSCKTCCGMFIAAIKERNAEATKTDPRAWLDTKAKEARETQRSTPSSH